MPFKRLQQPKPLILHTPIKKACVIGSGAFGTALACVLGRLPNKTDVAVWHMDQLESDMVNKKRENIFFLNGCPLPPSVMFTADLASALDGADIIAIGIPTQFLRSFLEKNIGLFTAFFEESNTRHGKDIPIVVGSKGIEESTLVFPTEIIKQCLAPTAFNPRSIAALAGPNFAGEIARGMMSAACVASDSIATARRVQSIISFPSSSCTFRLYASTDVVGCEVASAVKNVIAIAAGALKGMGHMLNCRAALICRGMAELTSLVDKLGGKGYALQGLAGVGDMLLTCSSESSRNFSVGLRLGQGEPIERIMANPRAVAEGVATSRALKALLDTIQHDMPICDAVYKVLYEGANPQKLFDAILSAPLVDEVHCLGLSPTTLMGGELRARTERYRKEHNGASKRCTTHAVSKL